MKYENTVNDGELAKFSKLSNDWWDKKGPLKTLHDINPARIEFILSKTSLNARHILDLGCGGGILTEALAEQGACMVGLDADEQVIKAAQAHALQKNLPIEYICSAVEDYEGGLFDVITCMEMLEHVDNPQAVINHCARLLKPGGVLFLSTINRSWKAYAQVVVAAEYVFNLLPRQTHDYEKFIKPAELARMVRKSGLEVHGLQGMSYNPWAGQAGLQDSVSVNYLMSAQKY